MAKLIVLEGPDKVGKSTHTKLLLEALHEEKWCAISIKVPIPGRTSDLIYWMLRNYAATTFPNLFQFVQFLNKLLFQLFKLPRLMKQYNFVVLDRWKLSSIVYGDATSVHKGFNRWLNGLLSKPDLTIVMCERSFKRSSTVDDSYEKDSDLQSRVREGYKVWALEHPSDHALISNDQPKQDVHDDIMAELIVRGIV